LQRLAYVCAEESTNWSAGIRPSAHIFVGSKADWYTIADDLPQHHEHELR